MNNNLTIAARKKLKAVLTISLPFLVVLASCNKSSDTPPALNPNELTIVKEYQVSNAEMEASFANLPNDPHAYDYHDFLEELQGISDTMQQQHTFSKVTYPSTDNEGNPIMLSGLLIYPSHGIKVNTPLIAHNHGTEMEKVLAPSQFVPGVSDITKYAEVMIAWSISALNGWAIIMPDYQGMGDDVSEVHPYCIKNRLATSTADMLVSAQQSMMKTFNPNWHGNTYIMGYSEGGYITMAALEELEKRGVDLHGALCMEGPYDLSGAMLDNMLADTAFPVPYFLPYMLVGYHAIYPDYFKYDEMLISPYDTAIPTYTTGFYSSEKVNEVMPADHILMEVFTDDFVDTLKNVNSQAFQIIADNNSYTGWTPQTETYLWHCVNDDCVSFINFTKVKNTWGDLPNVTYYQHAAIQPIFHTIHQTAAPIAFMQGTVWIIEREKSK